MISGAKAQGTVFKLHCLLAGFARGHARNFSLASCPAEHESLALILLRACEFVCLLVCIISFCFLNSRAVAGPTCCGVVHSWHFSQPRTQLQHKCNRMAAPASLRKCFSSSKCTRPAPRRVPTRPRTACRPFAAAQGSTTTSAQVETSPSLAHLKDPVKIGATGTSTSYVKVRPLPRAPVSAPYMLTTHLQDFGGDVSLHRYMTLPIEQYFVLDPSQIRFLGGDRFLLLVPRINVRAPYATTYNTCSQRVVPYCHPVHHTTNHALPTTGARHATARSGAAAARGKSRSG
jgi:hypothetical protein